MHAIFSVNNSFLCASLRGGCCIFFVSSSLYEFIFWFFIHMYITQFFLFSVCHAFYIHFCPAIERRIDQFFQPFFALCKEIATLLASVVTLSNARFFLFLTLVLVVFSFLIRTYLFHRPKSFFLVNAGELIRGLYTFCY